MGKVHNGFAVVVDLDLGDTGDDSGSGGLTAPMNGTMVALLVEAGSKVSKGDALLHNKRFYDTIYFHQIRS